VGCASVQDRVADTDHRVDVLEAQMADMQAALQNLTLRLTEIRRELLGEVAPAGVEEPGPDQGLRALQSEVGTLGEQLLILEERVSDLSTQLTQMRGIVQQQAEQQASVPPAATPPAAEDTMFQTSFLDYMAGEYVLAIDGFEEYMRRYPASDNADEALYWIGESLAAQERHSESRARFLQLIQEYPDSEMVAGARLRAALEAVELGQPEAAIQELRSVVSEHPGSDALLVACMQLERMQQPLPDGCRR
jgi:TolA-binding protein